MDKTPNVTCDLYRTYTGGSSQVRLLFKLSGGMPFTTGNRVIVSYRNRTLESVYCGVIRFNTNDPREPMYSTYLHRKAAAVPYTVRRQVKHYTGLHSRLIQVEFNEWDLEVLVADMGRHTGPKLSALEKCIVSALEIYLGQDHLPVAVKEYKTDWHNFESR